MINTLTSAMRTLDTVDTLLGNNSGSDVLDQVTTFVRRFSALPSEHCAPTFALWYAHTHIADRLYVTPRLILDSAEPGSGKTRVLEVAQYLVAAPEMTFSASRAALFRMVAEGPITILFDEVDTIFGSKAGGSNEDLRALLNVGYKRSATIPRLRRQDPDGVPVPGLHAGSAGRHRWRNARHDHHPRHHHPHARRRADELVEPFRERTVERRRDRSVWHSPVAQVSRRCDRGGRAIDAGRCSGSVSRDLGAVAGHRRRGRRALADHRP